MYHREPARVGVGIGAFGVAFSVLVSILLVVVPQELMGMETRNAYVGALSDPVAAVGGAVLVYGVPLLGAVSAFYLTRKDYPATAVVTGFVVGGLVLGLGTELYGVAYRHVYAADLAFGPSLADRIVRIVTYGGRLVGSAVGGVVYAIAVEKLF